MLCLDIGNSEIYGGYYDGSKISHNFRITTKLGWSSDQFGIFFRSFFREQNIDYKLIKKIVICSVVPSINYSIKHACIKYFGIEPFFVQIGVKTGLVVNRYKNPHELGSDIIAGCVAATNIFPSEDLIIADLGTATTIAVTNSKKEFFGGIIMPGIKTQANSLSISAEKLSSIDIEVPKTTLGKDTNHAILSGLYYGHLASISYLAKELASEAFGAKKSFKIIGTGGFSSLYKEANLFDLIESNLVLQGIIQIEKLNRPFS